MIINTVIPSLYTLEVHIQIRAKLDFMKVMHPYHPFSNTV